MTFKSKENRGSTFTFTFKLNATRLNLDINESAGYSEGVPVVRYETKNIMQSRAVKRNKSSSCKSLLAARCSPLI